MRPTYRHSGGSGNPAALSAQWLVTSLIPIDSAVIASANSTTPMTTIHVSRSVGSHRAFAAGPSAAPARTGSRRIRDGFSSTVCFFDGLLTGRCYTRDDYRAVSASGGALAALGPVGE